MKTIITWTAVFVTLAALASAGVPQTINYQGYLKNGTEPASGPTNMTFSLYSTVNGAGAVWSGSKSVEPVNGVYSVELGKNPQPALPAFDRPYWLGVQAGGDPEMRPLQALTSVPYALNATSISGQNLTSLDSRYIDPAQPVRPSPLQVATQRWDQSGRSGVFQVGSFPVGVAYDGANIWVANSNNTSVTKKRASDGVTLGTYTTGDGPNEIAFDGANIWVTNIFSTTVTKLRASDGVTLGTYAVGANPKGIAFDGANIWVANSGKGGSVSKLRASDGVLLGTYSAGTTPVHITFDGSNIWVTNFGSHNVSKLQASDGALLGTYDVELNPSMSTFDGTNIWVANSGSDTVSQLRASDGSLYDHFPVGDVPVSVVFDGVNLWVSHDTGQSIYKLRTDGTILNVYPMGATVYGLAFDGTNIWAVLNSSGKVAKIPVTSESAAAYIIDGVITDAKLAFSAVTTNNIANYSVTTGKIAVGAITTATIADGSVTTAKISGTIAPAKLDLSTVVSKTGDTITGNLTILTDTVGTKGVVVRGTGGQTANLQEWQNSGSTVVASVSPAGSFTTTGNLYLPYTSATTGIIYIGPYRLLHSSGVSSFYAGLSAGNLTTAGYYNSGYGPNSLTNISSGSSNSGIGYASLFQNTAGSHNTAIGTNALDSNLTASKNTAVGSGALQTQNLANGGTAWDSFNTAIGFESLYFNSPTTTADGVWNTALGAQSLRANSTGIGNTASGYQSLSANTAGDYNTASGYASLNSNTLGNNNVAVGTNALKLNTTAGANTVIGSGALQSQAYNNGGVAWNTYNTAIGFEALGSNAPTTNTNGYLNTALGYLTLKDNSTGYQNTAIGNVAGNALTTGYNNTFVGAQSRTVIADITNATAIGYHAIVSASNQVRIGDISVTQIGGQVAWSNLSDIRQKKDIADVTHGLNFIKQLRPVEYRMKQGNDRKDFGFIAQEVEALLGTEYNVMGIGGDDERTLSLRYTDFIAPLVKAVQEQQVIIDQLKSELAEIRTLLGR